MNAPEPPAERFITDPSAALVRSFKKSVGKRLGRSSEEIHYDTHTELGSPFFEFTHEGNRWNLLFAQDENDAAKYRFHFWDTDAPNAFLAEAHEIGEPIDIEHAIRAGGPSPNHDLPILYFEGEDDTAKSLRPGERFEYCGEGIQVDDRHLYVGARTFYLSQVKRLAGNRGDGLVDFVESTDTEDVRFFITPESIALAPAFPTHSEAPLVTGKPLLRKEILILENSQIHTKVPAVSYSLEFLRKNTPNFTDILGRAIRNNISLQITDEGVCSLLPDDQRALEQTEKLQERENQLEAREKIVAKEALSQSRKASDLGRTEEKLKKTAQEQRVLGEEQRENSAALCERQQRQDERDQELDKKESDLQARSKQLKENEALFEKENSLLQTKKNHLSLVDREHAYKETALERRSKEQQQKEQELAEREQDLQERLLQREEKERQQEKAEKNIRFQEMALQQQTQDQEEFARGLYELSEALRKREKHPPSQPISDHATDPPTTARSLPSTRRSSISADR